MEREVGREFQVVWHGSGNWQIVWPQGRLIEGKLGGSKHRVSLVCGPTPRARDSAYTWKHLLLVTKWMMNVLRLFKKLQKKHRANVLGPLEQGEAGVLLGSQRPALGYCVPDANHLLGRWQTVSRVVSLRLWIGWWPGPGSKNKRKRGTKKLRWSLISLSCPFL